MIEFGLFEVADSASLTLVFFPALVLLAVLGIRFAYYAWRNRRGNAIGSQTPIWTHLLAIGLLAALYGAVGVLEIVSSIRAPYKSALMLAIVLLIAFAIRQIHWTASGSRTSAPLERLVRWGFVAVVVVLAGGVVLEFSPRLLAGLEAGGAMLFLAYGATFYRQQTAQSRLQGTMIDSLLRHLLPVLTFAGLVNLSTLALLLGVEENVVPHIQVVFIIMTASTLMTATIKLRQNLASL